jgi:hypothetical protein
MVTNSLFWVVLMGAFPVGLVGTLLVAAIQQDDQESNDGHDNVGTNKTGEPMMGDLAREDDDWYVFEADLVESERVSATIDFAHDENDLALAFTDDNETEAATTADISLVVVELTDLTLGSGDRTSPPNTTTTVRTSRGPNSTTGRGGLARLRTWGWGRVDGRWCHSNGQWQNSIASTGRWSV